MSNKTGKKEETRQRMVEAASRGFRSHGFAGIGVDAIAKEAGVTSGAFYAHLGSKDGAFRAALDIGLDEVIEAIPKFQEDFGAQWVEAFADYYLSRAHREDLACGCAMAALSPEVVRAAPELHKAYETKMSAIANLVAQGLKGGDAEERRARAWAMLGVLIGGLTIARAVKSRKGAEEIATSTRAAAVKAAGAARKAEVSEIAS